MNNSFLDIKNVLETNYKRRKFYTQNFPYINPIEIKIENKEKNYKFFHYIPILQTLEKQLSNNRSISIEQISNKAIHDKILRNYTDGSVFTGIYMNIGNFPDHVQSRTNNMQLVALCREKCFNHDEVYGRIVEDLLKLEDEGIKLSNRNIVKGSVVFIAGYNLGSHSLGGFLENFSKAKYFCRYCLVSRAQFNRKGGALKSIG